MSIARTLNFSFKALILFLAFSFVQAKGPDRWIQINGRKKLVKISKKNCRISNSAFCAKDNCLAYKIIDQITKTKKRFKLEMNGKNPTSSFCEINLGKPIVGHDQDGNHVSICMFKDSSFIYGWDLFNLAYN